MLGMAFASTANHAQLLEISAPDTTGLGTGMVIAPGGDFQPLKFEKGRLVYDRQNIKPFTTVSVMLPAGGMFSAVVEPGQTLQMKLTKKDGKWKADYKGKNRDACIFQNEFMYLGASGWEDIKLDENGEETATLKKSFDFATEAARVDKQYALCKKLAAKIMPVELGKEYLQKVEAQYLSSRLAIAKARERTAGRDPQKSTAVRALLAEINPNDLAQHECMLTVPFIQSKLTTTSEDTDQTAYGIEFAQAVDRYVTNSKVKHELLDELAGSMFNADYNGQSFDTDKFWEAYTKVADQKNIDYYQEIVNSRHATASGTPCPDESFEDPQGNRHQLSEFFNKGRFTYIDIWATWCGPCCAEIPYIEKHVEHYKDNPRIQFISISIDRDHNAWRKKLDKDKPQWQQFLSATTADMDKLMKDWGITGIPRFVLINPDGTINQASAFRPSDEKFREYLDAIIK